jgi:hypothetical protein
LAIGDNWPTVVFALFNQVQLVATSGAMFHRPQSSFVVEGRRLKVPVAPDSIFGCRAALPGERIVGWCRTVRVNANDFPK